MPPFSLASYGLVKLQRNCQSFPLQVASTHVVPLQTRIYAGTISPACNPLANALANIELEGGQPNVPCIPRYEGLLLELPSGHNLVAIHLLSNIDPKAVHKEISQSQNESHRITTVPTNGSAQSKLELNDPDFKNTWNQQGPAFGMASPTTNLDSDDGVRKGCYGSPKTTPSTSET